MKMTGIKDEEGRRVRYRKERKGKLGIKQMESGDNIGAYFGLAFGASLGFVLLLLLFLIRIGNLKKKLITGRSRTNPDMHASGYLDIHLDVRIHLHKVNLTLLVTL